MRKTWEEPKIMVEEFSANEYVAACEGTEYGDYLFECNAGNMGTNYAVKDASGRTATISGYYLNGSRGWFTPCKETHQSSTVDVYLTGYHLDDPTTPNDENIEVIVWTNNNTDVHCTTNLDRESWPIVRS